jgi:hypothetical protein
MTVLNLLLSVGLPLRDEKNSLSYSYKGYVVVVVVVIKLQQGS